VADRAAVMYAGEIVEVGVPEHILYNPKHPYNINQLSSLPQLGVKRPHLLPIRGTPPRFINYSHGRPIAPRSPMALTIDFLHRPPYFEVSPTHKAKTWLLDPRAPKVELPEAIRLLQSKWGDDVVADA